MPALFANNAATTVASALSNVATSLTVASGKGALFPAITGTDYFMLTLTQSSSETTWEIVKVTARSTDVLTIVRGQEGTAAAAWAVGDKAELRLTTGGVLGFGIDTPSNVTPAQGATNIEKNVALTGSSFSSALASAQSAIQVQVSTSSSFASPLYSSGDQVAGNCFALPSGIGLTVSTLYFYRLRHKNARGSYSDWSSPTSFTTVAVFTQFIPTPAATPASAGASFEGGYYVGLQWNQLCQSTSYVNIATGTQTFTINIDQTNTPLFYLGQTVEVRSRMQNGPETGIGTIHYRSNRDQGPGGVKMVGTVAAGTTGTTLVINCTSTSSSGSWADWSVMARHRLIVSPKASGQFSNTGAYKLSTTSNPYWGNGMVYADYADSSDGKNTCAAIRATSGQTSALRPAAFHVATLSIGGYTDWYVPSPDEIILAHRYLKADPQSTNNYNSSNGGSVFAYGQRGCFTKTREYHRNNNSDPQISGNVYSQCAAGINFRQGESEAFLGTYASYFVMDYTDYHFNKLFTASASSGTDGWELSLAETGSDWASVNYAWGGGYWRAFRRSVI